jgi:hypothetical protein
LSLEEDRTRGKLHLPNWFFLDGSIHRVLGQNRRKNYVKTFDYKEGRVKMYTWEELFHAKEKAYPLTDVGKFVNRTKQTIRNYIHAGLFTPSGRVETPGGRIMWFFSAKDVMELRDFVANHTRSNKWYWKVVPTREQVRSMLEVNSVMYIKDGDDYIPVWESKF